MNNQITILKQLPFRYLAQLNLETNQKLEDLKKEWSNLPPTHPIKKYFNLDGNVLFYNETETKKWLLVSAFEAKQKMNELYLTPDKAFWGKRAFMYYFKQNNIYVKVRWIEEYLKDNVLHQLKKKKEKNMIVKPILAKGPVKHWQIDLIDFTKLADFAPNVNKFVTPEGIQKIANYILVVVDVFSKYCFLRPTATKSPIDVWKQMSSVLNESKNKFGLPDKLQHDQGNEFNGSFTTSLKEEFPTIENVNSLSHKPQSQGIVERLNLTIKDYLRQHYFLSETKNFVEMLKNIETTINNTYQSSIECAPVKLMKKLPAGINLPASYSDYKEKLLKPVQKNEKSITERNLKKKYFGEHNQLPENERNRISSEELETISHANFLLIRRAADKLKKFEKYKHIIKPFLNRDLKNDPIYVLISTNALYQRGFSKYEPTAKSLLQHNWTTKPTKVIRIWTDKDGTPKIITERFPNRAFLPQEVIIIKNDFDLLPVQKIWKEKNKIN